MSAPQAYFLCATPRSGSTLLCEMLAMCRVAGWPNSFFREPSIAHWAERWHLDVSDGFESAAFNRAYVEALKRQGENGTGLFGLRIMWSSVGDATRRLALVQGGPEDFVTQVNAAFGAPLYIHLSRQDKVAQAVSLLKAQQSGLWHLHADGRIFEGTDQPAEAQFDRTRLRALVGELEADDQSWRDFFVANGITPLSLTYEGVTANPQAALGQILTALGRDPAIAQTIATPTRKIGDASNEDWAARFLGGE